MTTRPEGPGPRQTRRTALRAAAALAAAAPGGLPPLALAQGRTRPNPRPPSRGGSSSRSAGGATPRSRWTTCGRGQAHGPGRDRPDEARGFPHAQAVRPDLHHDQLAPPGQRPVRPEIPRHLR